MKAEHPYPPGWLDRTIDWIDRMPGTNGLYSLALFVLQLAWVTGLIWLGGKVPIGSIDLPRALLVVITPYLLWFRFHLDRQAAAALETFRPALDVGDAEFRRLRYELTTLPARTTRIVTAAAVVVFVVNFFVMPEWIAGQHMSSRNWTTATFGPIAVLTIAVVASARRRRSTSSGWWTTSTASSGGSTSSGRSRCTPSRGSRRARA